MAKRLKEIDVPWVEELNCFLDLYVPGMTAKVADTWINTEKLVHDYVHAILLNYHGHASTAWFADKIQRVDYVVRVDRALQQTTLTYSDRNEALTVETTLQVLTRLGCPVTRGVRSAYITDASRNTGTGMSRSEFRKAMRSDAGAVKWATTESLQMLKRNGYYAL